MKATEEDKELLLKDLCARLPYGVIIQGESIKGTLYNITTNLIGDKYEHCSIIVDTDNIWGIKLEVAKPYLRPMSNMTEEEKKECRERFYSYKSESFWDEIDWYNKRHLDYRGLIEKGLAIEVNKDNNPYKYVGKG